MSRGKNLRSSGWDASRVVGGRGRTAGGTISEKVEFMFSGVNTPGVVRLARGGEFGRVEEEKRGGKVSGKKGGGERGLERLELRPDPCGRAVAKYSVLRRGKS